MAIVGLPHLVHWPGNKVTHEPISHGRDGGHETRRNLAANIEDDPATITGTYTGKIRENADPWRLVLLPAELGRITG